MRENFFGHGEAAQVALGAHGEYAVLQARDGRVHAVDRHDVIGLAVPPPQRHLHVHKPKTPVAPEKTGIIDHGQAAAAEGIDYVPTTLGACRSSGHPLRFGDRVRQQRPEGPPHRRSGERRLLHRLAGQAGVDARRPAHIPRPLFRATPATYQPLVQR
jgi:hypothetical protein